MQDISIKSFTALIDLIIRVCSLHVLKHVLRLSCRVTAPQQQSAIAGSRAIVSSYHSAGGLGEHFTTV